MNTLTDLQATDRCDSLPLQQLSKTGGRVHSIFQRACNLQTPSGELWVIQAQGMPLAPLGIIINSSDLRPLFRVGESLRLDSEGNLCGEKVKIGLNHTAVHSTRLPSGTEAPAFTQLARQIEAFFARQPAKGIRLALLSDDKLIAAQHALVHWLQSGEKDLSEVLTIFIGRGEGLTPSGDDFLLGVLLVLEREGNPKSIAFKAALPGLLARTTDISRAMLEQGCRGHYSALLLDLATGNRRTWPEQVAKVADYGHTSGHDMLTGMLTAMQASGERGVEAPLHIGPL